MTVEDELPLRVREADTPIRFFFDESCLGIGQVVARARSDVVYPGHPRCQIKPGDLDPAWLPIAADADWIVVLRDRRIRHRPAERDALARHHLRVLVLTGSGNLTVWDQLRLIVRVWDHIERVIEEEPGPWLYSITRAGLRQRQYPAPP